MGELQMESGFLNSPSRAMAYASRFASSVALGEDTQVVCDGLTADTFDCMQAGFDSSGHTHEDANADVVLNGATSKGSAFPLPGGMPQAAPATVSELIGAILPTGWLNQVM